MFALKAKHEAPNEEVTSKSMQQSWCIAPWHRFTLAVWKCSSLIVLGILVALLLHRPDL